MKSSSVPDIDIVTLDRADIVFEPRPWRFATERRAEIERYFAGLQRLRTGVWNGRAILLGHYAIDQRVLRGSCFETDYASFSAWREWQLPDPDVYNIFAVAALQSADGAYLVAEMAADTASAGQLYFPCGTPEPDDIDAGGRLDLEANLRRELAEETGLDVAELASAPGFTLVRDRGYLALLKRLTARLDAQELRARILRHIASEARPELADIRIVRGPADLDPAMPDFVVAFLEHAWRA